MNQSLQFMPILKSLLHNKTGALLIAIQTAFTLSIVVNASFIIAQRVEKMARPTGMDTNNIITLQSQAYREGFNGEVVTQTDLKLLRDLPGVIDAAPSQAIPLSGSGWSGSYSSDLENEENDVGIAMYFTDDHMVDSLGIHLKAGRNFRPEEISFYGEDNNRIDTVVIVTDAAAKALYPEGDALGKPVYANNGSAATIIGIIEHMQGAWVSWDGIDRVMLIPKYMHGRYLIRAEPGSFDGLFSTIEESLVAANRDRLIRQVRPMSYYLANSYELDRAMSIVLIVVVLLLIVVAGLGIVSLASFYVNQRIRQIGTRRALGATRFDILSYFLLENWIITTTGIVLGSLMSGAFSYWLTTSFDLPILEWYYVLGGILTVWFLGLLSAAAPARTASLVSPAIATRNV